MDRLYYYCTGDYELQKNEIFFDIQRLNEFGDLLNMQGVETYNVISDSNIELIGYRDEYRAWLSEHVTDLYI